MSLRSWILVAVCAALTIGTFTPEQAQAGWRRRCGGRVYGCSWRGGCGWRGGWGGWNGGYGGYGGCGYGGYAGYGGYGVCSTGGGFGGNYLAGFGASYATPYVGAYSLPYYANADNIDRYLGGAGNVSSATIAPSFYTASMSAGQRITTSTYPGDPVVISSPTTSFLTRHAAVIRNANSDRSKVDTSFVARHSSGRGNTIESNEQLKSEVNPGYVYGYGLASGSGFSYKARVVNAPRDLANFGLTSVVVNP